MQNWKSKSSALKKIKSSLSSTDGIITLNYLLFLNVLPEDNLEIVVTDICNNSG